MADVLSEHRATRARAIALALCATTALHDSDSDANYERLRNWVKKNYEVGNVDEILPPDRETMRAAASAVRDMATEMMAESMLERFTSRLGDAGLAIILERVRREPEQTKKPPEDGKPQGKEESPAEEGATDDVPAGKQGPG